MNVRRESDVDVGVLCDEAFFGGYPTGLSRESLGYSPASYGYTQFKNELEEALVAYFGRAQVVRGNKAFDVTTPGHIDADVVPFFEYRWHYQNGSYTCGVALAPDRGGLISNYPERLRDSWPATPLHYENGVGKNTSTSRTFKGCVRILKRLRDEMEGKNFAAAREIPRYLLECMAWNVSNERFAPLSWADRVRNALFDIWTATKTDEGCRKWTEVDGLKFLFHSSQPWTRLQAHTFANTAWDYLGLPRT